MAKHALEEEKFRGAFVYQTNTRFSAISKCKTNEQVLREFLQDDFVSL